jgi:hypothetical protein
MAPPLKESGYFFRGARKKCPMGTPTAGKRRRAGFGVCSPLRFRWGRSPRLRIHLHVPPRGSEQPPIFRWLIGRPVNRSAVRAVPGCAASKLAGSTGSKRLPETYAASDSRVGPCHEIAVARPESGCDRGHGGDGRGDSRVIRRSKQSEILLAQSKQVECASYKNQRDGSRGGFEFWAASDVSAADLAERVDLLDTRISSELK